MKPFVYELGEFALVFVFWALLGYLAVRFTIWIALTFVGNPYPVIGGFFLATGLWAGLTFWGEKR